MTSGLDWCAWHKGGHADGVRLIHIDYRGPGPDAPVPRSACAPCRWEHNLVPLAYPAFGEQPRTTRTRE
ncbi:hypothetical protein [Streptomyces chartreusis]